MKKNIFGLAILALISFLTFDSCKKDKLLTDSGATLAFSVDTIQFDTVFTTIGSATQVFTVRNTYDQPLKISSITLSPDIYNFFRLNVNGTPGKSFTDVEIGANDSIFIFAEVTLDPNNQYTPLMIEGDIIFNTNGHQQNLPVVSYGQNAHFFPTSACGEEKSQCTPLFKLKDCGGTSHSLHWINDKPYVIYGYAILDSGYTLTIDPGVRIHFHNSSGLIVLNTAKLIVNGTLADPVTFQGDRLGEEYKDVPGQWDRIWFSSITSLDLSECPIVPVSGGGPIGNVLNYAIIKNGFVGIQTDTAGSSNFTAVELNNCIIKNCASTAFYGNGSYAHANNCVFANCGEYLCFLPYGGAYRFLHCTFANYWSNSNRSSPSLLFNNYFVSGNGLYIRPIDAYFGNCIVYGNQDTEIGFDTVTTGSYVTLKLDHCLYKIDNDTYNGSSQYYLNSIKNADPNFRDIDNNYYKIDSTSIAVNLGLQSITDLNPTVLSTDIEGKTRPANTTAPDAGAYEDDNQ
ncbi:hypothetical protein BH11BAC1_BH11BAC1_15440 [soil metagenome]